MPKLWFQKTEFKTITHADCNIELKSIELFEMTYDNQLCTRLAWQCSSFFASDTLRKVPMVWWVAWLRLGSMYQMPQIMHQIISNRTNSFDSVFKSFQSVWRFLFLKVVFYHPSRPIRSRFGVASPSHQFQALTEKAPWKLCIPYYSIIFHMFSERGTIKKMTRKFTSSEKSIMKDGEVQNLRKRGALFAVCHGNLLATPRFESGIAVYCIGSDEIACLTGACCLKKLLGRNRHCFRRFPKAKLPKAREWDPMLHRVYRAPRKRIWCCAATSRKAASLEALILGCPVLILGCPG